MRSPALLKFIGLTYISLTFLEYFIHRHIMHAEEEDMMYTKEFGKVHHDHHLEVENNFTVTNDTGLVFTWFQVIFLFSTTMYGILYVINNMAGTDYDRNTLIVLSMIISILYGILWNTLHISFHSAYDVMKENRGVIRFNIPDNIKKSPIVSWLWKNHFYHHINKKNPKGNFNIILPGADFFFGTYKNKVDNNEYCKNKIRPSSKDIDICKNIPNEEVIGRHLGFM